MGFIVIGGVFYGELPHDPAASPAENMGRRVKAVNSQLEKNFADMVGEVSPPSGRLPVDNRRAFVEAVDRYMDARSKKRQALED